MRWLVLCGLFLLLCVQVLAPPTPHNVAGSVFHNGTGAGVANGIPVLILDTTEGTNASTEVFAPPVPQLAGAYSSTISGTDGDALTVRAWNATHYGLGYGVLASTTRVNVTLNLSRSPEVNVSIVAPVNDSVQNVTVPFNVSIDVVAYGGTGACNLTLFVTNSSVLSGSSTYDLGTVSGGDALSVNITLTSIDEGSANVTVVSACSPNATLFEATITDTVFNITIVDAAMPDVTLLAPADGAINKTSGNVTLVFNATDDWDVDNCSLYVNGTLNQTDLTITEGVPQEFNVSFGNGNYTWQVRCTDPAEKEGVSSVWSFGVEVLPPWVNVSIVPSVTLVAGSQALVSCNVSVYDLDGFSNIIDANATLHYITNASGVEDPSVRYDNGSCTEVIGAGNWRNYTCSFSPYYFAVNGTWVCNATAVDAESLSGTGVNTTVLDALFALNVTETMLSFGDLLTGDISANITQNVSNIGNQPLNVTVFGYGQSIGDGNAFACSLENISVGELRYAIDASLDYSSKQQLTGTYASLGMIIPRQTAAGVTSQNASYWQLHLPANVSSIGDCNGSLVFHAALS